MIDHLGLSVSDVDSAKTFFTEALTPLGYAVVMDFEHEGKRFVGLGVDGKPDLWLEPRGQTTPRLHIAFRATTRGQVDAFYKAAMARGAQDNGGPGLRPDYHEHYYAAFVIDADGHNIEAVCHTPE